MSTIAANTISDRPPNPGSVLVQTQAVATRLPHGNWFQVCGYVGKTFGFVEIQGFPFWRELASMGTVLLFYFSFIDYGPSGVTMFMDEGHAHFALEVSLSNQSICVF